MAPPNAGTIGAVCAGIRRAAVGGLRLLALRLAAGFAVRLAVRFGARLAARFREVAVLRALVFREAPARERAVRFVFRAALFVFFLPRGGILLLREPGSHRQVSGFDRIRDFAELHDENSRTLKIGSSATGTGAWRAAARARRRGDARWRPVGASASA